MYQSLATVLMSGLVYAWLGGNRIIRFALVTVVILTPVAGTAGALIYNGRLQANPYGLYFSIAAVGFGILEILLISSYGHIIEARRKSDQIVKIETAAREHPDQPQLAWDAARARLENYLDRNLGQLGYIFWLTVFVMMVGFGMIIFGIIKAYDDPERMPASAIAATSGVFISFIGGSFLLVYRYILDQAKSYVTVLERINAVGMAVQVLGSISDDDRVLRNQSTAALAKQLLHLYAADPHSLHGAPPRKRPPV
ncbi:TRADD-N-associated membrane domain-containing protein [Methylorubrum aminovorans]